MPYNVYHLFAPFPLIKPLQPGDRKSVTASCWSFLFSLAQAAHHTLLQEALSETPCYYDYYNITTYRPEMRSLFIFTIACSSISPFKIPYIPELVQSYCDRCKHHPGDHDHTGGSTPYAGIPCICDTVSHQSRSSIRDYITDL